MREKLVAFANEYAAETDSTGLDGDEQRSIHHPLVFLFLGDKSAEALQTMAEINNRRWNNSTGVVYLHVGTERSGEESGKQHTEQESGTPRDWRQADPQSAEERSGHAAASDYRGQPGSERSRPDGSDPGGLHAGNIYTWTLPVPGNNPRSARPDLHDSFRSNREKLLELNVLLRRMNSRISEFGRLYSNLQRLNIAVVTRLDDPCNVLLPELTALMETIFGEHFRSVIVDLYGLLEEKQVGEEFALRASMSFSFLRELDVLQSRDYTFSSPLQVTGEGITLPAQHGPSPLFDTVYLLSDKDERGIFTENGMKGGYETISSLNLLKYRHIKAENEGDSSKAGTYNHQHFKQNIAPPGEEGVGYVSAGYSRVSRPNQAIALTVLYHLYRHVREKMEENVQGGARLLPDLISMEPQLWDREVESVVPGREQAVEEMYGLMHDPVSYGELKSMSLKEAELALFQDSARRFFDMNVRQRAEAAFAERGFAKRLERIVKERIVEDPAYGYYALNGWLAEEGGAGSRSLPGELRQQLKDAANRAEQLRGELDNFYGERVDRQPIGKGSLFGWKSDKASVKNLIRYLLDEAYGLRRDLLVLELKQKLMTAYLDKLEELRERAAAAVRQMDNLEKLLRDTSRSGITAASDYLGRNINEYYEHVVKQILTEMEGRRESRFYFDERFLGNVSVEIDRDAGQWLRKLMAAARRDVLVHPLFHQTFEAELLERANVAASYDNRDVLSKEDLFRDLYTTLENEAAIRIDVYHSTHRNRHEEKYFFGDSRSEFIQYAFAVDGGSRTYKLGCVHEKKPGGIEKLRLMGGFRLEDLMVYRNSRRYYETYTENGYRFHSMELPETGTDSTKLS
ncbi:MULTISPECIES: hypothetical protein [unclassified Paenibacillus]|uniref:hypothetical protein n=1 Tax=unclassified Paenibacillus TaxID=185978 RepID=UPI00020D6B30|nr:MULTISPECIES: hypothetical protein [unclassified Paenibacillus]EGL19564.1 hypothetical protein HMPREF9413_4545 [Paenibacillus sp. HGF7]EPD82679.1 hypothetical protein HMPREF1207_03471 [Paenibacillus sp. HGH0039]